MRLKFIVCKVLQREAYLCAARSRNVVDIVLMPQGLHNEPDRLRSEVQDAMDNTCDVQDRPYDAAILGYGLCSNGIVGLSAKIPIVVPRGHDCITLLLGSKEKYQEYFDSHRGDRFERLLKEYEAKYSADNARYLMETEQGWMKEYSWAAYVDWGLIGGEDYKQYTRDCAEFLHWSYDEMQGDPSLMQRLVDGDWNEAEFLTVKPGEKIIEDLTNPGIIGAE